MSIVTTDSYTEAIATNFKVNMLQQPISLTLSQYENYNINSKTTITNNYKY